MADEKKLVEWLLRNSGDLDLKIERLTWIEDVFPQLHDFSVEIQVRGKTHRGYGAATEDDLALVKAFAEAIERAVTSEKGFPTSNGLAANVSLDRAKESSLSELLERDSILCHYYTRMPYPKMRVPDELRGNFKVLEEWYESKEASCSFYQLGSKGVLFVAEGEQSARPFGYVLGAARKNELLESLYSAAIESTRQLAHILAVKDRLPSLTLTGFSNLPNPGFRDHGLLALDLEFAGQIRSLFSGADRRFSDPIGFGSDVREVKSDLSEFEGCPLVFARAQSPDLQDIFLGEPTPSRINLRRLSDFAGRPIEYVDINPLPHPFN